MVSYSPIYFIFLKRESVNNFQIVRGVAESFQYYKSTEKLFVLMASLRYVHDFF